MYDEIINPGMTFLAKSKWFRELGMDTSAIERMIIIECRKNLSVLDVLRTQKGRGPQDAVVCMAVARRLQYEALEALVASDDRASKALSRLHKVKLPKSEADTDSQRIRKDTTVSDIILRLYVRMYSVRTLAQLQMELGPENQVGLKKTDFRKRLDNIRESLLRVERALSGE